ncbi:hypothetical protein T492DRAFT_521146 [Pavlovales sp. CCMP2436]|nr:hypothetical protein T492DRAFT_521146 [Pavlovales sp. CCMP2436]
MPYGCSLYLDANDNHFRDDDEPIAAVTVRHGNFVFEADWPDVFGKILAVDTDASGCVDASTGLQVIAPFRIMITSFLKISVMVTPLATLLTELGRDTHRLDADVAVALGLDPAVFPANLLSADPYASLWQQTDDRAYAAQVIALQAAMCVSVEVLASALVPRDSTTGNANATMLQRSASAVFTAIADEVLARISAADSSTLALGVTAVESRVAVATVTWLPIRLVPTSSGLDKDAAALAAVAAGVAYASQRAYDAAILLGAGSGIADIQLRFKLLSRVQVCSYL